MILVDANLLLVAKNSSARDHEKARCWLDSSLNGTDRVGLPWASLLAFVRIITHPRLFARPMPVPDAWWQVEEWLSSAVAWIPSPGERHAELLGDLLARTSVYGDLVPDAHLAALAMEHGLTVCSNDGDFGRFPGLRWHNPLAD